MKIYLAPMEGVVDSIMRDLLTSIGGFDYCVTEFLRITNTLYPNHVFFRHCPELRTQSKTPSGTPVLFQLLGSDIACLSDNAVRAVNLGAFGIDLNFGCPAKTVNRHDGGATLLKSPSRVFDVVYGVRKAVPDNINVSAKIRLGFEDKTLAIENAIATEEGGASMLIVHARTKKEGYKPPAHWDWIRKIKEAVNIPVVANGDIWNIEDYLRCLDVTQCTDVMIGRGALSMPDLALQIKSIRANEEFYSYLWPRVCKTVMKMFENCWEHDHRGKYPVCRTKQWLKMLSRTYKEAQELFENIKIIREADLVYDIIKENTGDTLVQR
ncbi:tRNA dihydrouridine synthase [Candidatus Uabimicrobium sp. HlEnr_7]|uniref:tRNA dihydrouridine synthase n=1 Tax=Candidatus Uabimicrobium helgolandensis TaxID=3095367 RepID=UPI003555E659